MFKVGFAVTGIAALNLEAAAQAGKAAQRQLKEAGLDIVAIDGVVTDTAAAKQAAETLKRENVGVLLVLVGTFTQDPVLLKLHGLVGAPTLLWAIPEHGLFEVPNKEVDMGSLVGAMMNASALRRMDAKYRLVFGGVDDPTSINQITTFARAAEVTQKLHEAKVGLVGYRAPGFYDATVDEVLLKKVVGPEIIHVDLTELTSEMDKTSDQDAIDTIAELERKGYKVSGPSPSEQIREAKIYLSLRRLAQKYGLSAVSVKCWPELQFSSCLSLSLLSDQGIPGGCEGDINGAVTMLLLHYLTGSPVFFCDVFHLDEKKNSLLTYHCGAAALSLAPTKAAVTIAKHPLGVGLTAEFPIRPGAVTLARLGHIGGRYRLLIAQGEALPTTQLVRGNPSEIRLKVPVSEFLRRVSTEGIEHHYLVVHGDVKDELVQFCELSGIEEIVL